MTWPLLHDQIWWSGPMAAKQARNHHFSTPCALFDFLQMWSCVLWTNISTLVLLVKRTLFQKYYWFTYSFADLTNTSIFFLERRGRQEAIVWLLFQTSHTCLVFFYFILLS